MSTFVIFDSLYGNTEQVANAIASALGVTATPVADARLDEAKAGDLVIVGCPTHGGRPTDAIVQLLSALPSDALLNVRVAAFDTRFAEDEQNAALRLLMKTIGFAAPKIANLLAAKSGMPTGDPIGFISLEKKGPLKEGELQRAAAWATALTK